MQISIFDAVVVAVFIGFEIYYYKWSKRHGKQMKNDLMEINMRLNEMESTLHEMNSNKESDEDMEVNVKSGQA
jgi:hypothetical protein